MSGSENGDDIGGKPGPESKVSQLIDAYGLTGFGAELERRWTAEGSERSSLRDLAAAFNRRLLRTALAEANFGTLDGEVENLYRLLTDDDVSSGARTKAVRELRQAGIDVEDLESDFVSHRAMHTYLTSHRDAVQTDRESDVDPREKGAQTLRELSGRVERVTDETLGRLVSSDELTLGPDGPEVYVDIQVYCPNCGTQYSVQELLGRGGCDCQ